MYTPAINPSNNQAVNVGYVYVSMYSHIKSDWIRIYICIYAVLGRDYFIITARAMDVSCSLANPLGWAADQERK